MAWSNPSTQSQSDLITAAIWNQNVVANPQFLYDNLGTIDSKVGYNKLAVAANFSFTSLSSSYDSIYLQGYLRSTYTGAASDAIIIRFNNDSGSNYAYQVDQATTTTPASGGGTGQTSLFASALGVQSSHTTPGTLVYTAFTLFIPSYANSSYYKAARATSAYQVGASGATPTVQDGHGWWRSASAINRIDISAANGTFEVGSFIAIFGAQSI